MFLQCCDDQHFENLSFPKGVFSKIFGGGQSFCDILFLGGVPEIVTGCDKGGG